jgi:hypothetical protein
MLPEQTIQDLHELHEKRVDLIIWHKNFEQKKDAIDRKQRWLLACWVIGIPLLVWVAGTTSSKPFVYWRIEQQMFWATTVAGAIIWSIIFWRRLSSEELQNLRQRTETHRRLDELENRLHNFNPPLKNVRQNGWWMWK